METQNSHWSQASGREVELISRSWLTSANSRCPILILDEMLALATCGRELWYPRVQASTVRHIEVDDFSLLPAPFFSGLYVGLDQIPPCRLTVKGSTRSRLDLCKILICTRQYPLSPTSHTGMARQADKLDKSILFRTGKQFTLGWLTGTLSICEPG